MKFINIVRFFVLLGVLTFMGCNASSTTDGQPNRGGDTTSGQSADQQRGGTAADGSQGNGRPGTSPSPSPT
ncbi:MAG: hypothetical protein ABIQ95_17365 [Bdellovibrionia bacterium]